MAAAGLASRREAEKWISAGRVSVNGRIASIGDSADPEKDHVEVDGRPLGSEERKYYVLLNKPVGYVSSRSDPEGRPVVTDLVREIPARLYPVGRLDLNTEGLLLLTNDGALANRLAHPRRQVEKTYLVRMRGTLSREALERLEGGILLEDGMTAPARVDKVRTATSHSWFHLTIREGRNRQVRRMCAAVGHPVLRLVRTRIGPVTDRSLRPGEWRALEPTEVRGLEEAAAGPPGQGRPRTGR